MIAVRALLVTALVAVLSVPVFAGGNPAPNFSLKTNDGKTVELKSLAGKVVVVNFWATWCGPCRAEIPGMLELYKKYRSKGLEIIGVSLDRGGWNVVNPFVETMKITYPVVLGDMKLTDAYGGVQAIPTTFVIDRKGNIVEKQVGAVSEQDFEKLFKPYL